MQKLKFKITDRLNNTKFIEVDELGVRYFGSRDHSFSLAEIAGDQASLLREALERAWKLQQVDGARSANAQAMVVLDRFTGRRYTLESLSFFPPKEIIVRKNLTERCLGLKMGGWMEIKAAVFVSADRLDVAVVGLDGSFWRGNLLADGPESEPTTKPKRKKKV